MQDKAQIHVTLRLKRLARLWRLTKSMRVWLLRSMRTALGSSRNMLYVVPFLKRPWLLKHQPQPKIRSRHWLDRLKLQWSSRKK